MNLSHTARRLATALLALGVLAGCEGAGDLTIDIGASPARVYTWLVEPAKMTRWISGLKSIKPVGSDLAPATGGHAISVAEMPDGIYTLQTDYILVEPGKTLVSRLSHEKFDETVRCDLADLNGGTRLHYVTAMSLHPWFTQVMTPMVTRMANKKLTADLARLKQLVEADSSSPATKP